jgi:tetratricopeptide (TPR) repeat protein
MKLSPFSIHILFYALGIALAISCSPSRFPVIRPSEKADRSQIDRSHAEICFIEARDRERRGRFDDALQLYERAYGLDTSSKLLMEDVVRGYINTGRFKRAFEMVRNQEHKADLTADDKRFIAGVYWRLGDYSKAVEATEKIIDKEASDFYTLAMMNETTGNTARALQYYREYYRRNDESFGLGLKIMRMLLDQNRIADAETMAVAIQVRHGEKAEVFQLKGAICIARGDTAGALEFFKKALAVDSLYEDALRASALVYLQKNDYTKAIDCYEPLFRNAEVKKPEYGRTLAMLYYYSGRYAEAAEMMTAIAKSFIDDADFHLFLGLAFAALGKNEQARIEMEKSLVLREEYPEAWRELVNLSLRGKEYTQAFETAKRYMARLPLDGASWRLAGYALSLEKQFAKALSYFEKSVKIDSMDANGWFELGSCFERSGDIPRAADAFRKVLRLRPEDPAASNYLGYMWAEKGIALDSAKVLVESALSKEPGNGAFLDSYAWILYQLGRSDESYRFIMKAVARIHDDPVVFEHLGDILHKRNDSDGAAKAYAKSLEYNPDNAEKVRRKIIECRRLPH